MRRRWIAVALALTTVVALDAQAPELKFEVASIRPVPSSNGLPEGFAMNPRRVGTRLSWTTNLFSLVSYAYRVPSWRIQGIVTEQLFYRLDASMAVTASPEEVRSMLRQLLVDRFKLATRTSLEERPGYELVVVSEPKLQRAAATGQVPPMPAYMKEQPPEAFDGAIFTSAEGKGIAALTGRGVPLAKLAEVLSEELRQFVIDRTSTTGTYYFGFTFRRLDYANADAPDVPSLFDALREELGLKLNSRRGPVEILVIDSVQQPTEN